MADSFVFCPGKGKAEEFLLISNTGVLYGCGGNIVGILLNALFLLNAYSIFI